LSFTDDGRRKGKEERKQQDTIERWKKERLKDEEKFLPSSKQARKKERNLVIIIYNKQ